MQDFGIRIGICQVAILDPGSWTNFWYNRQPGINFDLGSIYRRIDNRELTLARENKAPLFDIRISEKDAPLIEKEGVGIYVKKDR